MKLPSHPVGLCRRRLSASVLLLAVILAGCASHQVRTPDSDPLEQTYESRMVHAYFWGAVLDPQVVAADCEDGLNDVIVEDNFLYDLAGVLTLGIWMPGEVRYRCHAPAGDLGGFPEAPAQ